MPKLYRLIQREDLPGTKAGYVRNSLFGSIKKYDPTYQHSKQKGNVYVGDTANGLVQKCRPRSS